MKKTIVYSLTFIFLLCILSPIVTIAQQPMQSCRKNSEYGFSYFEHESEDGRIIRKYEQSSKNYSREYTKALLSDLGMRDSFITELSDDSLMQYYAAESITSITMYTRTDDTGNIEVVSEETAMKAASTYSLGDIVTDSGLDGTGAELYHAHDDKAYAELCFMVLYMGDGVYHFSMDATWLTIPNFRGWDSIGIIATHIEVINSTRSGWFKYDQAIDRTTLFSSTSTESSNTIVFSCSNADRGTSGYMSNCSNGTSNGAGAIFLLPTDASYIGAFDSESIRFRNFRAHIEFDGAIESPTAETTFSAVGSYDHSVFAITVNPSITIGGSGVDVVILNIAGDTDPIKAELDAPITYVP